MLNYDSVKPIYLQISDWLEGEIINGNLLEDERIYSQYQLAEMFNVNPATAGKSLTSLFNENIIYKKRGLGMFVSLNAKDIIINKRKTINLKNMINELINEANRLNMTREELLKLIENYNEMEG